RTAGRNRQREALRSAPISSSASAGSTSSTGGAEAPESRVLRHAGRRTLLPCHSSRRRKALPQVGHCTRWLILVPSREPDCAASSSPPRILIGCCVPCKETGWQAPS